MILRFRKIHQLAAVIVILGSVTATAGSSMFKSECSCEACQQARTKRGLFDKLAPAPPEVNVVESTPARFTTVQVNRPPNPSTASTPSPASATGDFAARLTEVEGRLLRLEQKLDGILTALEKK